MTGTDRSGRDEPLQQAAILPRWLPFAFACALAVPFDPYWLDFEQARRCVLLLVVGLLALLRPTALATRPAGDRVLAALFAWLLIATLANRATVVWPDAVLRMAHLLALFWLLRLGARTGGPPWAHAASWLLLLAAGVGLLQSVGLPLPGGTAAEPASLFGNRNVAAEFVAVAGASAATRWVGHRRLAGLALGLGAAYAVVNGSRSALVALPLALAFLALAGTGRRRERFGPLLAAAAGGLLGLLLQGTAAAAPAPAAPPAAAPAIALPTATLEVRFEIARGALHMVEDAPWCGNGPGQFAVQYPRYRSQREIDLSSLGRHERRRVATAHDDWLESATEGGVPALLLLLAYAIVRFRDARGDRARLAPLLALGALMLVRAPLGNAPAAALALLASAGPIAPGRASRAGRDLGIRAIGLVLLLLGTATLAGAGAIARYAAGRTGAPLGDPTWLQRSTAVWPYDPTAWQLLAQERQARAGTLADATAALAAVDRAVALRPFEPSYLLLRADLLRSCGRSQEAKRELARVAGLDPGEPQVNVQLAGIYFTEHNTEGAVAALFAEPPPLLRAQLAERLDELVTLAQSAGDDAAARRFLAEASFVRALDATGHGGARAAAIAKERFDTMRIAFRQAGLHDRDLREYIVLALQALDVGDRDTAATAAVAAGAAERTLPAWQWPVLRAVAPRLRELPAWRALLPAVD